MINIENGPATEWKEQSMTTNPRDGVEFPDKLIDRLVRMEADIKGQIRARSLNPRLIPMLAKGYSDLGIQVQDPKSEDIHATITGQNLANAFIEEYKKSLQKTFP